MGPKSILFKKEEDKLVNYMIQMKKLVYPLTINEYKLKVAKFVKYDTYSLNMAFLEGYSCIGSKISIFN